MSFQIACTTRVSNSGACRMIVDGMAFEDRADGGHRYLALLTKGTLDDLQRLLLLRLDSIGQRLNSRKDLR